MAPPPVETSRSTVPVSAGPFQPPFHVPAPETSPQMTTAAMEAFRCIAEQCEDSCCRDWAVPVNRADLDRMTDSMKRTPAGRERLLRLVVIGNPSRTGDGLAHLQMDDACACPMLEPDSRCGVHSTFGEQALTTPCAVFPRTSLAVDGHLEVGGSLGCPEVARLTLTGAGGLRLRPAGRPMLSRPYVGKAISDDPQDAYARHFTEVRESLLECFRQSHLGLGTQFVLAADLADRTHSFFHPGTREFQGPRASFAESRLRAELAHTRSPDLHRALENDLGGLEASGAVVTGLVTSLLSGRRAMSHSPRFGRLLDDVFGSLHDEAFGPPMMGGDAIPSGQLWEVYARRRAALDARMGRQLASLFSNYAQHFVLRNPYTEAATLLDYLYNLGVQLAAVRFLAIGHPDLEARLVADPDPERDAEAVTNVVVHVTQTFTKAISHHPDYLRAAGLGPDAPAPTPMTFGRLVLLAKFL